MIKTLHDFRVMFKYYRLKHSDLMIEVNANRRNIINLEDDGWETELDRAQPYMTKFDTYESSSDDLDASEESGSYSRSRDRRSRSDKSVESSEEKSQSKSHIQDLNPSDEESSEEEEEENNTVPEPVEQKEIANKKDGAKADLADQADFDDINES